jgi:hypothetical protein
MAFQALLALEPEAGAEAMAAPISARLSRLGVLESAAAPVAALASATAATAATKRLSALPAILAEAGAEADRTP